MSHLARIRVAVVLACLLVGVVAHAEAQTRMLTVHLNTSAPFGDLRVISGGGPPVAVCSPAGNNPCTVYVNQDASIELVAAYPGGLSAGTGPAAGCTLSTCSFTMTADADITVGAGAGSFVTLTTTLAGDGSGTLWADGAPCRFGSCAVKYLVGSTVRLSPFTGTARFGGYSAGTGDAAACGSAPACTFTLTADASVTGSFRALTSFTVSPSSALGTPGGAAQGFTATGTYSDATTAAIGSTAGAWSSAPSFAGGVDLAAAALGGRIYALGSGGPLGVGAANTVSEFDPGTGMWSSRAPMLTKRARLAAATAGGQVYAIGGITGSEAGGNQTVASVEHYDPATDAWTMTAPMAAARAGLVAGTINGIIYVAGGIDGLGNAVTTLEAYDPATGAWTQKAPMPAARGRVAGGVIDGTFYVVGGDNGTSVLSTNEAYDPATNSWSVRAPLPVPLAGAASAVADGVLYVMTGRLYGQSVVYAYDPVADAWSAKAPMLTPLSNLAAASLSGIVYAIGGTSVDTFHTTKISPVVQTFADGLRWSSSAPAVARIDQTGRATPLAPGTATIVANVGGTTCGASCPTFTVAVSQLSIDVPASEAILTRGAATHFKIDGWAINRAAPQGTGVDAVHIYAQADGALSSVFLGAATYGIARSDIGALYGSQFTNSGFELATDWPAAGRYTIYVYAHNALTGTFDVMRRVHIQIYPGNSNPFISVDTPTAGQTVTSAFEVAGWALDAGAGQAAPGVDPVEFFVQPQGAAAPGVFIGTGSYGIARPDVGALFGSAYTNSGFHFTITGMSPGSYTLNVYARSLVTNNYNIRKSVPFTVSATALMSIDIPTAEATVTAATFDVGGWSIDRNVESTASSGSGVDAVHIYAYPNPGSGQAPIFLGVATLGVSRPDVGAIYGARYDSSGYSLTVDRNALGLAPGVYNILVASHSSVSGTFNNLAVVRVTIQ